MKRSVIVACLLLAGAGPATLPSTQPSEDATTLQARLDAANARIAELERELAELRAKPAEAATPQRPAVVVVEQIRDDGTALALKRIAAKHVRPGQTPDEVVRSLGEPKEKRRDGARDVFVYKRADAGRQNHGTFVPGPRYTLTLTFDVGGKLETSESADR